MASSERVTSTGASRIGSPVTPFDVIDDTRRAPEYASIQAAAVLVFAALELVGRRSSEARVQAALH